MAWCATTMPGDAQSIRLRYRPSLRKAPSGSRARNNLALRGVVSQQRRVGGNRSVTGALWKTVRSRKGRSGWHCIGTRPRYNPAHVMVASTRRSWSREQKRAIVAEARRSGTTAGPVPAGHRCPETRNASRRCARAHARTAPSAFPRTPRRYARADRPRTCTVRLPVHASRPARRSRAGT
jgi:transposase-like protein